MKLLLCLALCLAPLALVAARPNEVPEKETSVIRLQDLDPMMVEALAENFRKQLSGMSSLDIAKFLDETMTTQNSLTASCNSDPSNNFMSCSVKISMSAGFFKYNGEVKIEGTYVTDGGSKHEVHLVLSSTDLPPYTAVLSTVNPPPICLSLPYTAGLLGICVEATNLNFDDYGFSGCFHLQGRAFFATVVSIELACVDVI